MSLALGPNAFDAVQRLKQTADWKIVTLALYDQMDKLMHGAIEIATPETCGYARGIRDVVWALEIIEAGQNAPSRAAIKPKVAIAPGMRDLEGALKRV